MKKVEKYTDKVIDHFMNPRNMGIIENPDAESDIGSPVCGDRMHLSLKIVDGRIEDIKFKTFGCGAAIASSSILTEMVKGKTVSEAEKITKNKVVKALDGLPELKVHCSLLAVDALKEAIKTWKKNNK
ncbi:iron-sulfur cluster assembly scaffold protein [bacterium]|nr:iron-sulfur cluster assembly scaffold protein [bacterium]